jgi:DNA-binding NarL/FixJ family response regulator
MAAKDREEWSRIPLVAVRLTRREVEVLSLIADGWSTREAGDHLCITKRTVDYHIANILAKLRAKNRLSACRIAQRLGLIHFEPTSAPREFNGIAAYLS